MSAADTKQLDKAVSLYLNKDYKKSYDLLLPMANTGNDEAQSLIASMYETGKGVLQDKRKAVDWYKKSAKNGNSLSQNTLGVLYEMGDGVLQDYKESYYWYKKSADQGDPYGLMNTGIMLLDGLGVQKNKALAAKHLRKAHKDSSLKATSREMIEKIWAREELWKY